MITLTVHSALESVWRTPLQTALATVTSTQPLTVYVGSMQDAALKALNKQLYDLKQRLFVITPGTQFYLGPGITYGYTPCIGCYQRTDTYFAFTNYRETPTEYTQETAQRLAEQSATYIRQFLEDATHPLRRGYILALNPNEGALVGQKRGVKNVTCRVCSKWNHYPLEVASV